MVAALIPLAILLTLNLVHVLQYAAVALGYPYEFDYGEGIVWQQMRNIVAGQGYGPIGVYPAIVYHYPPVYHLTVALTSVLTGMDQLMAGRTVSLVCTFLMAGLVGLLSADLIGARETLRTRAICGGIGGLLLLSCNPVISWSALMRVDMLCHALTLGGLALAIRSIERPGLTIAAGIAFTLAVYCKQTSIAAPVATATVLAIVAPRQALFLIATCLAIGLPALGWFSWSTNGGFLRHILLYNVNRFAWSQGPFVLKELQAHLLLIVTGIIGAWTASRPIRAAQRDELRAMLRADRRFLAATLLSIYLILTTAMVPMIMKSGANNNYLIEWLCAISIFAGFAASPLVASASGREVSAPLILTMLFAIGLPVQVYAVTRWKVDDFRATVQRHETELAPVVRMIRSSPKPVIADDMTLLIRAGRPVLWEPAIAAELAHDGLYDEKAFAKMIRQGHFGFFVTRAMRGNRVFDSRYDPAVADAMDAAYPRMFVFADEVFHLPAKRSPPVAPTQQAKP